MALAGAAHRQLIGLHRHWKNGIRARNKWSPPLPCLSLANGLNPRIGQKGRLTERSGRPMINLPLRPRLKAPHKHLQTSPTCTAQAKQGKLPVTSSSRIKIRLTKSGSQVVITNQMWTQVEQHCKLPGSCKTVQVNKARGNRCIPIEAHIKLIEVADMTKKVNRRDKLKCSLWTRTMRINTAPTSIRISTAALRKRQISKTKCTSKEVISSLKFKEQAQPKSNQITAAEPWTSPRKTN